MGNYRDSSIFLLGALAACSSNTSKAVDAPIVLIDAAPDAPKPIDAAIDAAITYDFSCEGVALSTNATTSITLSGGATTVSGTTPGPAAGVSVALYHQPNGTVAVDTQTTASNGTYTMAAQLNPSGMPYDAFLKATLTGNSTTYVYPASPFLADTPNIPVLILPTGTFGLFVSVLGGTQTAGNGALGTAVTDCAGMPVDGATLIVTQGGQPKGNTHSAGALDSRLNGTFFTFDVPPGDTEVSATYGTHTWRVHTVKSYADATTTTIAMP